MDEVVATNGECVTIARDHPDHEIWPCTLEASCDRGGAPVDGVEAEGVHVVRQSAGAADPGDEDDFLLRDAKVWHGLLRLGQNRVVAAAWAPAHILIGLEVLLGQDGEFTLRHLDTSTLSPRSDSAFASISD